MAVQEAVEQSLIQAAKVLENELDSEIDKLDNMDGDGLEKLR